MTLRMSALVYPPLCSRLKYLPTIRWIAATLLAPAWMVPRGWVLMAPAMQQLFFLYHHQQVDVNGSEWNVSTTVPPNGVWTLMVFSSSGRQRLKICPIIWFRLSDQLTRLQLDLSNKGIFSDQTLVIFVYFWYRAVNLALAQTSEKKFFSPKTTHNKARSDITKHTLRGVEKYAKKKRQNQLRGIRCTTGNLNTVHRGQCQLKWREGKLYHTHASGWCTLACEEEIQRKATKKCGL